MGNSLTQQVNSGSTGLGFFFSYPVNRHLTAFSNQNSILVQKKFPPTGITVVLNEMIPFDSSSTSNSDLVVFRPLTALQILYSAPGELWNWNHRKPQDFSTTRIISARDGIIIPTSPDEITRSEEYTCVVSTKDGYPKMTHLYGNIVVECHPIPRSMLARALNDGNQHPMDRVESSDSPLAEEFVKHCYICRGDNKQMSDYSMHKSMDTDGAYVNEKRNIKVKDPRNKMKEIEN